MTTQSALTQQLTHDYSRLEPLPDPPKEFDMWQRTNYGWIIGALLAHFGRRNDVLISGDGYLCHEAREPGDLAPDLVFATGVADPYGIVRRNGYVISEVGKPPDLVLEIASRSTGRRDYTMKREAYAAYGVKEYWRFDPSGGRYHDAPLAGDALVDGEYARLEIVSEPDGRSWGYSEVLGLELWWEDENLRFRDPGTGEFLRIPEELQADKQAAQEQVAAAEQQAAAAEQQAAAADQRAAAERATRGLAEQRAESERAARGLAEQHAESERAARGLAEQHAESERAAREAAEARTAELEAELRRLRDE